MQNLKFKKIVSFLGTILLFGIISSTSVSAANMWDTQIGSTGQNSIGTAFGGGQPNIKSTIYQIINTSLTLLAIIFVVLAVVAGFIWMTSMGDPKKVETAMAYLKNAVIGLVIILASKGFTIFVLRKMLEVTSNNTYYP